MRPVGLGLRRGAPPPSLTLIERDRIKVFDITPQGADRIELGGGVYETVKRADKITVRALNRDGQSFELETDGLLAVCIQHEIDHLDGKLFVDYLSQLKRTRIRKKLEKERRHAAVAL